MRVVSLAPPSVTVVTTNCALIRTTMNITGSFAGINEENSAYSLKKDEIFRTPELALTYSNEGLSGSSRNFHRWARLHKLAHGTVPRKILLNSWEGVYFDVNRGVWIR